MKDLGSWVKLIVKIPLESFKFLFLTAPRWVNCNVAHRRYWVITGYLLEDDKMFCKKCRRKWYGTPYSGLPEEI